MTTRGERCSSVGRRRAHLAFVASHSITTRFPAGRTVNHFFYSLQVSTPKHDLTVLDRPFISVESYSMLPANKLSDRLYGLMWL